LVACKKNPQQDAPTLKIYVAASLTEAIQEIGQAYSQSTGVPIIYNFGGSGALAQQMIAAPRGDLFFSANLEWMERAVTADAIDASSVQTILANQLVLVAHRNTHLTIHSPDELCRAEIKLLSIGDPAYVPAGAYAKQWLQGIPCGELTLWEQLKPALLPAIDVRAALAQVLSSQEAIGIVYQSDYVSRSEQLQKLYSVPIQAGPEIRYAVGILSQAERPKLAAEFLDYLQSEPAVTIFKKYGFIEIP
jgi:molybdate transport system substrate-binding protein